MFVVAARIFCVKRSPFPPPLASRCGLVTRSALKGHVSSVPAMGLPAVSSPPASFRVDRIGGYTTEILEVRAERPAFQVFFVPGNPGVVAYYKEFVEALFDYLDGQASVTAISHIAHVSKDWEFGKKFALQDQINHKVQFVRDRLLIEAPEVPLLLVGHSIGAYIALEILKKFPSQVQHVIGLYPFVTLNKHSNFQSILGKVATSPILCTIISTFAGLVGRLPKDLARVLVKVLLGRVWDPLAIDVTCRYMLQKNVVDNFLYMGRTEFASLSTEADWSFLKENQNKTSFLFGIDDHWGPLSLLDEISKKVPELHVATEREGHLHAFCCTKAGSKWVARFAADTIFNQTRCARL
ncbi:hypothetical protein KC19_1G075300 [Ceratodon purpureus]|uniref:Lipid droplet-associated hydrolase n=1 Tax=Ceratodon purpureus TaxID=3225 RepID=A0A8T0J2L5_CERPU|nr:hypothetical protein KC19_1G075300 [Ceratodon purpureus]